MQKNTFAFRSSGFHPLNLIILHQLGISAGGCLKSTQVQTDTLVTTVFLRHWLWCCWAHLHLGSSLVACRCAWVDAGLPWDQMIFLLGLHCPLSSLLVLWRMWVSLSSWYFDGPKSFPNLYMGFRRKLCLCSPCVLPFVRVLQSWDACA